MNLKNVKYLDKFRRLKYSKNEMLIIGTGTMALFGLKENKDLDVWATESVFRKLKKNPDFIEKISNIDNSVMYETKDGTLEFVHTLPPFQDSIYDHLKRAIVVYGIHFQSLADLLKWKKMMNRQKDKEDIEKIENFLKNNIVEKFLHNLNILR